MKRSEINRAVEWAGRLLAGRGIRLPRYAYWDMDKWAENKEQLDSIREGMLGWDVTDLGGGSFPEAGAVCYTLRNGGAGAPCRERYILMREGQRTPVRVQAEGADLINRAGGVLSARLWSAGADGGLLDAPVRVWMDGIECEVRAGGEILIYPGDSLSLAPGMAHSFGPAPGYGDLILTELSAPVRGGARPGEIEEDERVLFPLCWEYAKLI